MSESIYGYSISKSLSTVLGITQYGEEIKIYWKDECGAADSGDPNDTFTVTSSSDNFAPSASTDTYSYSYSTSVSYYTLTVPYELSS